jgi:hypothetical protein
VQEVEHREIRGYCTVMRREKQVSLLHRPGLLGAVSVGRVAQQLDVAGGRPLRGTECSRF